MIVGNPRDSFWPKALANFPSSAGPFMNTFVGLPNGALSEEPPATDLLGLLGVNRVKSPSGVKSPSVAEVRDRLFPSVIAASVDDRSFRFTALEALPFACLGPEFEHDETGLTKGISVHLKFGHGK